MKPTAPSEPPSTPLLPPHVSHASWDPFPEIDLRQLLRMTDDTGIFQHAVHGVPDPNHGYCIDDNARALIAALLHARLRGHDERTVPLARYLGFLAYAYNEERGRFRNFMGYDRRWLEDEGSQDSQARTYWALGLTVHLAPTSDIRELAQNLFLRSLPVVADFQFIRSWAFALIGLEHFLAHDPDHAQCRDLRDLLANRLFDRWQVEATDEWPWWDETVTYDNAKLCHALLLAGASMHRPDITHAGLRALAWLIDQQTDQSADGSSHLSIIGNDGWLRRGHERARFDQQPLEAYALADACLTAARRVDDAGAADRWADTAWWCFQWFLGQNDLNVPLYHPDTGGCQDGLRPGGPNKNQGAESILAYLLTVLELHQYRADYQRQVHARVASPATVGLGVVGAGSFAGFCLDAYAGLEGIKPVAIWNRTPGKADRLADAHGMRVAEDLPALLADPAIHLIHIATTPDQHAAHARAALGAGKHVLIEKPIAMNLADADELIRAAAQRDRVLAVNFPMRYGPLVAPLQHLLQSGTLGAPLRGMVAHHAADAGLPADHWFWDETVSGGIFLEQGIHFLDLMRCLLGEATVLSAHRLRRPDTTLIDQAVCDARFGTQTSVGFYHGFTQAAATDRLDVRLLFERGELRLSGWIASRLTIEAALSDAQVEQVQACLPGSELTTLERYSGKDATVHRRHRMEAVDRMVRIVWADEREDGAIYAAAARGLLADVLKTVHDRHHALPVTGPEARAALSLALDAGRIARGITP